MPIEIRELHIRVRVNERPPAARPPATPPQRDQDRQAADDALLAECLEQVREILKAKKER